MTDNQDLKSFQRLVQKGKQTRKEPPIGDLFCLTLDPWETSQEFFWGRLIKKDCKIDGGTWWLTYIYNNPTETQTSPDREWKFEDVLIAPDFDAKSRWNIGAYKSSGIVIPVTPEEQARTHYFKDFMSLYMDDRVLKHRDEYGNLVVPPKGVLLASYSIGSLATQAWSIDNALGRNDLYDYRELNRRKYNNPNKTTN